MKRNLVPISIEDRNDLGNDLGNDIDQSADIKKLQAAEEQTTNVSAWYQFRLQLPTLPEALASLLRTVVIALFALTFLLQPFLIPSESMEHTLLVGDFLLFNKQELSPPGRL